MGMAATALQPVEARIWDVLSEVPDPEVPAVSIVDLGMVREVTDGSVAITPTYTGCPATLAIHAAVRVALDAAGFTDVAVRTYDLGWIATALAC
jgi:ring-1,2-phenylacetyl-CoA epoxidase subunit PaaD